MNEKTVLAVVAGIADPIFKKWAQKLASLVPVGSAFRTKEFESVIGALKGWIEVRAEKLSPISGVAVEKATDLADFFSGALGPSSALDLEKWASEVMSEAGPRLKQAQDPVAEMERIKLEIQLRKQLVEIIKQDLPSLQPSANWQKVDEQATTALTEINRGLEGWLSEIKKWKGGSHG